MSSKKCSYCEINKELTEFDKRDPKHSDTLRADCKLCRQIRNRLYYQNKKSVVK